MLSQAGQDWIRGAWLTSPDAEHLMQQACAGQGSTSSLDLQVPAWLRLLRNLLTSHAH